MSDLKQPFRVEVQADGSAKYPGRWIRIRTLAHLTDAITIWKALTDTMMVRARVMRGRRRIA